MVYRSGTHVNSMYMQNFSLGRRLTFANLRFCGSSSNFSLQNLGAWHLGAAKVSNPREFSPQKSHFSSIRQVFSLQSFYCTVLSRLHDPVAGWISGKDRSLAQSSYSLARCGDWLSYAGERVNLAKSGCHPRKASELEGLHRV